MKVSRVSLTRDERAVFLRNFVVILTGMSSSSDVGCVEDDPEWGVFRRCKADAGVAEGDSFEGESESESRMTLGLRRVRVRVLTWGDERQKSSADTLLDGERPSTKGSEPPKTSTSLIAAGTIAFVLSGFNASPPAFEVKGVLAFKSSSSSRHLSFFLHENSNFGNDCGLPSSQVIEISQSGGELGGTSSERPGGAVLCILSRKAELGTRDELEASGPLEVGSSSRRRP